MAVNEGEEHLLTAYTDVHYYFSAPTPRPPAHRFDKGSYLYFYGNKDGSGGRLEIANNVGKPEQDAFTGSMESTTIRQSHKHPTLCTVTVDDYEDHHEGTISPVQQPEHHWRLPNTDPRNEGKYLFRLHTLDIYFWTVEDANKFMSAVQHKLQPNQVQILDAPRAPAAHKDVMSPVVQQLENVAIQDPAYRNGQTRNSRTASAGVAASPTGSATKEAPRQETAGFQPLAYNPAAPPAPEPIKHREKTPPPEGAEAGTGLAGAAYRDHTQAMSPQSSLSRSPYGQPQTSQGYVSPQSARGSISPYTPTPAFAAPPYSPQATASPGSQQLVTTSFSPPPPESATPFYTQGDPQDSPATEILGNSYISGHRQPLQHLQPQYASYTPPTHKTPEPIGGYSKYHYIQQQSQDTHPIQSNEYDIHTQVYRPTEEEASKHKPSKSSAAVSSPTGKLEQGAGKIDKRVNRFFKSLDKKIG